MTDRFPESTPDEVPADAAHDPSADPSPDSSADAADDFADNIPADDRRPEDIDLSDALALEPDEDVDEFADDLPPASEPATPVDPADAPGFFDAGVDLYALDDLTLAGRQPVLDRLGPAHFRSRGFSFMGFLQTVYDHVATEVKGSEETPATPAEPLAPDEPS